VMIHLHAHDWPISLAKYDLLIICSRH